MWMVNALIGILSTHVWDQARYEAQERSAAASWNDSVWGTDLETKVEQWSLRFITRVDKQPT